jgi:uncharacterized protein with von Willebrand factor type A (vWA) domain
MIGALARFVAALRAEGHPVAPSEVIDASRALGLVGLDRRAEVRSALRATLAKDRRSAAAFDRLFDTFFAPPRREGRGEGRGRPGAQGDKPRQGESQRPGAVSKKPDPEREAKTRPGDRVGERKQPVRRGDEPRARDKGAGRLRRSLLRRDPAAEADPRKRNLARRMTTDEERAIAAEVPRMVRELRLRLARRSVRANAGKPWMRRAVRESLKYGGVPFVLPLRAPKRKRTRVVLMVDVSYSVVRAAGLFLLMAAEFLDLRRDTRVLAFVDKPVEATAAVRRWTRPQPRPRGETPARPRRGVVPGASILSGGVAFADVLHGLTGLNLDAPSDYGRAFHALLTGRKRPRGRDTVLVVLGDGRTNRFDPLPWAFDEVAKGCRAVIWLVPEPASRWGTADSALPKLLPSVDVAAEATDLDGLASGLAELVRRI